MKFTETNYQMTQKCSEMDIDKLNQNIRNCKKCGLVDSRNKVVTGEGNLKADMMLIAQAPGEKEDKKGEMFIGPSGKILDQLLEEVGIERDEVYLTNLIKCMLPNYREPKQKEIQACSSWLDQEIDLIDPTTLVPLGWYSTRYLFRKYNLELPDDKSEAFSTLQWIPDQQRKIYPLSHPASLLYDDRWEQEITDSYKKLGVLIQQCKWYSVCPMRSYYQQGKLDRKWIELYCKGDWGSCVRYQKEEQGESHLDWMLPDGSLANKLRN